MAVENQNGTRRVVVVKNAVGESPRKWVAMQKNGKWRTFGVGAKLNPAEQEAVRNGSFVWPVNPDAEE